MDASSLCCSMGGVSRRDRVGGVWNSLKDVQEHEWILDVEGGMGIVVEFKLQNTVEFKLLMFWLVILACLMIDGPATCVSILISSELKDYSWPKKL